VIKKIFFVLLSVFIISSVVQPLPVQAQDDVDRDGEDPIFYLGICAIELDEPDRDGVTIMAGHYIDLHESIPPYTEIYVMLTGYNNPDYIDFGLPLVPDKESTYSLTPGFLFGWSKSMYPLEDSRQKFSVMIQGVVKTLEVPTALEAYQLLQEDNMMRCPDPWPEQPYYGRTYIPLFLNGQN
jgi:hypothetical protein